MRRLLLLIAASASALAVSGTAAAKQSPGDFIKDTVTQVFNGQFDREWSTLHPAQQKLIPLDHYVTCNDGTAGALGQLDSLKVIDSYDAPKQKVPGTSISLVSTAVTVKIKTTRGISETDTFHAYLVNGSWRWALDSSALASYRGGKCP